MTRWRSPPNYLMSLFRVEEADDLQGEALQTYSIDQLCERDGSAKPSNSTSKALRSNCSRPISIGSIAPH